MPGQRGAEGHPPGDDQHRGDGRAVRLRPGRHPLGDEGTATYELFKPKGETGDNNTFTRLGGIAPIATGDMGYVVVFTTERGSETAERLNGTRDVAVLRVARGFADMDEDGSAFVDGASTQSVTVGDEAVTNKLTWRRRGQEAHAPLDFG